MVAAYQQTLHINIICVGMHPVEVTPLVQGEILVGLGVLVLGLGRIGGAYKDLQVHAPGCWSMDWGCRSWDGGCATGIEGAGAGIEGVLPGLRVHYWD